MVDKVAIVGGSVAGLITALNISRKSVDLFEEHPLIGFPFKCSGLINARLFEELNVGKETIQNKLCKSIVVFPSGKSLHFDAGNYVGYVINRPKFEREIAGKLGDNVKIYLSKRIDSLLALKSYSLVIGADGAQSLVRKCLNFPNLDCAYGVQYEINYPQEWTEAVTLFIDKRYSNYHVWNIPVNKKVARVGLAATNVREGFRRLDEFVLKKFGKREVLNKMFGAVPVGYLDKIVDDKVVLVGDAAGQSRPLSGGGLNLAIKYGRLLGKAINEDDLDRYETRWKTSDGQKNQKELKMLSKWKKLSNQQIEEAGKNLITPDFKDSTLFTAIFRAIIKTLSG